MDRNAVVSVFLRRLEYQKTVMFLTTNRVDSFDPAFSSRISIAIGYEPLDYKTRVKVWDSLLRTAGVDARALMTATATPNNGQAENDQDDDDVEEDAKRDGKKQKIETMADIMALDLNGREIRGVIRVAQTMAVAQNSALSVAHLRAASSVAPRFVLKKK